jgi:hypothetical protein
MVFVGFHTQLMNDLAPLFGASLCEEFVIPNITVLASDPMFRVRKVQKF